MNINRVSLNKKFIIIALGLLIIAMLISLSYFRQEWIELWQEGIFIPDSTFQEFLHAKRVLLQKELQVYINSWQKEEIFMLVLAMVIVVIACFYFCRFMYNYFFNIPKKY